MHRRQTILFLAALALCMPSANAQESREAALDSLKVTLAGAGSSSTLEVRFECQKRIASVNAPLISTGELLLAKDERGRVSMRLSTLKPYVSDLILSEGKTRVRSQHETAWTTSNQSSRPGHTAVLAMIGEWSMGELGKTAELFSVRVATPEERFAEIPNGTWFVLEASNKDLAASVRKVTLGFSSREMASGAPAVELVHATVETAAGDVTRYRFFDAKGAIELPGDIFKPVSRAGGESP